jgi:hypothetical protein
VAEIEAYEAQDDDYAVDRVVEDAVSSGWLLPGGTGEPAARLRCHRPMILNKYRKPVR